MVRNISARHINSSSATEVSVGEYNTDTKVIKLWCYYNRFKTVDGAKCIDIQDCDLSSYLANAKLIVLVDLDWDNVYPMGIKEYLAAKVVTGHRRFFLNELTTK